MIVILIKKGKKKRSTDLSRLPSAWANFEVHLENRPYPSLTLNCTKSVTEITLDHIVEEKT